MEVWFIKTSPIKNVTWMYLSFLFKFYLVLCTVFNNSSAILILPPWRTYESLASILFYEPENIFNSLIIYLLTIFPNIGCKLPPGWIYGTIICLLTNFLLIPIPKWRRNPFSIWENKEHNLAGGPIYDIRSRFVIILWWLKKQVGSFINSSSCHSNNVGEKFLK